MQQAKFLLDSLLGDTNGSSGAGGLQGLAARACGAWDDQPTMAKGAIAGGLLGVLLSGNARRLIGTGVKVGGAALIGELAYKAYTDWQAGQDRAVALPKPAADFEVDDNLAERLLQAMVAAAKADGHVTPAERTRIDRELSRLGLEAEAQALIAAELDSPLDVGRIAGLARNEAEAVEIYAASLLVVDPQGSAERGYLALLAGRLGLEPELVAGVHAQAAAV